MIRLEGLSRLCSVHGRNTVQANCNEPICNFEKGVENLEHGKEPINTRKLDVFSVMKVGYQLAARSIFAALVMNPVIL